MSFLDRPNCKIFYDIHIAGGEWVTLINGHTRTSSDFRVMAKKLNSAGFNVLVFDNRASGKSETDVPFSIHDIVGDVLGILKEEKITKTHVLGISMGGGIAQSLALSHPDIVDKLILVSTAPSKNWIPTSGREWGSTHESVRSKMATYFTPDFVARNQILLDAMSKQILAAIQSKKFDKHADLQRAVMRDFDATAKLKDIKAETLVIHGVEDAIIKVGAGRELAAGIPGAKLVEFEKVGHLLLAESSERFYQTVIDFLQA